MTPKKKHLDDYTDISLLVFILTIILSLLVFFIITVPIENILLHHMIQNKFLDTGSSYEIKVFGAI